jgi:hypothetical protein
MRSVSHESFRFYFMFVTSIFYTSLREAKLQFHLKHHKQTTKEPGWFVCREKEDPSS